MSDFEEGEVDIPQVEVSENCGPTPITQDSSAVQEYCFSFKILENRGKGVDLKVHVKFEAEIRQGKLEAVSDKVSTKYNTIK